MSASREKKKRQEQYESGELTRAASSKPKKTIWKAVLGIVCAVVFVLVFVLLMFLNTGFMEKHTTAATIGDHKLTPAMYNYFYKDSISTIQNNYGSNWSSMVDTTKPYSEQIYDQSTGQTWEEYFLSYTNDAITEAYAVYDAAMDAGFTLDEDTENYITSFIDTMETSATTRGYSSANALLAANYGKGCNTDNYAEYLHVQHIASAYAAQIRSGYTYTDEEKEAYYNEHHLDYDMVNFRIYMFDGTGKTDDNQTPTEEEQAAALVDAEAKANEMASKIDSEDEFLRQAYMADFEQTEDQATAEAIANSSIDSDTLQSRYTYSWCTYLGGDECATWLFDENRQAGDTTTVTFNNYACVVYFLSRENNDYNLVNVRHILIAPEEVTATADEDEAETAARQEQAKADALARAQTILDTYLAGDQTAEAFGELANANSADTGSNTNGGLYENIYKGQTVEGFDDWCFDPVRKPGDTGIVETTYGYHIMYYVGTGDTYQHYLANNALVNQAFTDWTDETTAGYTLTTSSFDMKFVNKD